MKKIYYFFVMLVGLGLIVNACVDDYEDANPPRPLDAPDVKIIPAADTVLPNEAVTLTINITDSPGGIDSLGVQFDESLGTLAVDDAGFEALKGKDKGSFTAVWTAGNENVGPASISFLVFDKQKPRKSGTATSSLVIAYPSDAPDFTLSPGRAVIEDSLFLGGAEVNFTWEITAPGGIGEVAVESGGIGTVTIDQNELQGLKGKNEGTLSVKYKTPNQVGVFPVSFVVFDNTGPKRPSTAAIRPFTVDSCSYTGPVAGTYEAVAEGVVGAADSTYSLTSNVTLTQPQPGVGIIAIDDLSFGLYSKIYDRATKPSGTINLCDGTITQRKAMDIFNVPFTISGTVNDDGTISIQWSSESGDFGEVTLTKI